MTTQRRAFHYLLLFVLLAGHWVYATHLHEDASLDDGHHCQLCLQGAQFDSFLPAEDLEAPALAPDRFFLTPVPANRSARHNRFHDSRAPPHG